MLKKPLHSTIQKLYAMDQIISWPDPRVVSYKENGKDKKIEKVDLDATHCHSYLGKMRRDGKGTYSDDVVSALLDFFVKNTKKWEKIVIELANTVSTLLNKNNDGDQYTSVPEQREHMLHLAKKINKKRMQDIEIVDIEDRNKALFALLKNSGIQWLATQWNTPPELSKEDITSLDIAKYLYRVCQNDATYFVAIKSLKPNELKSETGDSDYYGLVELAIRINAYLHGITLQWGIARQKKYDELLLKHINPHVKEFPSLVKFQEFCALYLTGESFKWLYFNTEKSEELIEKIKRKEKIKGRMRTVIATTLGLVIGALWTNELIKYQTNQQIQKEVKKQQEKDLQNKALYTYSDMFSTEMKTLEEKEKFVNDIMNEVYQSIEMRYELWSLSKKDLTSLIKDDLLQWNTIDQFFNGDHYDTKIIAFADIFIKQHKNYLLEHEAEIVPYLRLKSYEEKFKNAINLEMSEEEAKSSFDVTYATFMWKAPDITWSITPLWRYQSLSGGEYDIWTYIEKTTTSPFGIWYSGEKTKYVFATFAVNDKEADQDYPHTYSLGQSKVVAFDYFEQTRPVVGKILAYYSQVFQNRAYDVYTYNMYGWACQQNDRRELIIKDLVNTGKIDEIPENDAAAIVAYVMNFVKEYRFLWEQKLASTPYSALNNYREALENSVLEMAKLWNSIGYIHEEQKDEYKFDYLGTYITQEGKEYKMWSIEVNGVMYIVGQDALNPYTIYSDWEERVDTDYYMCYWSEIAKDYFDLKKHLISKRH